MSPDRTAAIELSVVIPTWNAAELVSATLEPLVRQGIPPWAELIVVDDGSEDETSTTLRSRYPAVTVLEHATNRGFGSAVNTGFQAARGRYVATVNNDVFVSFSTLRRLCEFLTSEPRASAASPRVVDAEGQRQQIGRRRATSPLDRLARRQDRRRPEPGGGTPQELPYHADWLQAACVVFNRAALEQVGLFDEQFYLFAEEIDLFHRLSEAGWQAWVVPDVEVKHLRGATTRNHKDANVARRFRIQSYRSMCIYYRKHFAWPTATLLRSVLALRLAGRLLRSMARPAHDWRRPRGPHEQLRCLATVLRPCVSRPHEPALPHARSETDPRVALPAH